MSCNREPNAHPLGSSIMVGYGSGNLWTAGEVSPSGRLASTANEIVCTKASYQHLKGCSDPANNAEPFGISRVVISISDWMQGAHVTMSFCSVFEVLAAHRVAPPQNLTEVQGWLTSILVGQPVCSTARNRSPAKMILSARDAGAATTAA